MDGSAVALKAHKPRTDAPTVSDDFEKFKKVFAQWHQDSNLAVPEVALEPGAEITRTPYGNNVIYTYVGPMGPDANPHWDVGDRETAHLFTTCLGEAPARDRETITEAYPGNFRLLCSPATGPR
jgi:hypothetical protein